MRRSPNDVTATPLGEAGEVHEPMRRELDPRLADARRRREAEGRKLREEQLASGAIEGKYASPQQQAARMKEITGPARVGGRVRPFRRHAAQARRR